jgi:integrase
VGKTQENLKIPHRGYYLVRKSKSVKTGWRVVHESYVEGKKKQKAVPKEAWSSLGFSESMSYEEAKGRGRQLNQIKNIEKDKVRKAAQRVVAEKIVKSTYIPRALAEEFVEYLKDNHFGNTAHELKLLSQWQYTQEMVASLELEASEFYEERKRIYKYFIKDSISPSYVSKLLRIINLWGNFLSKKRNQHYEQIPAPRGIVREKIQEAYAESERYRGEGAFPMTKKILNSLKEGLDHLPGQYEWVHVAFWFGLRPGEMSYLKDETKFRIEYDRSSRVNVLWVYQSKLTSLAKSKRWKPIPVIYPEQKRAIEYIKSGVLKRPLNKTLKALTGIDSLGSYSGRKGFTDLMLGLGQSFEDISVWLGHATVNMTWKHYKDRKKISFTPLKAG